MLQIFIISLKQDVFKREVISKKLNDLKVDFVFVDAVYGKELSEDFCQSLQLRGKLSTRNFYPTRGEIGCTLSHISVFSKMINEKIAWACILEDDAIIDESFGKFVKQFDGNHFNENDLFILGGQEGLSPAKYISKSFFKTIVCAGQKFSKVNYSERFVNRTCCYVVHQKFARKIVELSKDGFYLADDWQAFQNAGAYRYMYLAEFVAHPLDLASSSIEMERQIGRNSVVSVPKGWLYSFFKKVYLTVRFVFTQLKRFY